MANIKSKYAMVGNVPVFIMKKASENLSSDKVAVQSLLNGESIITSKKNLKGFTNKYPMLKK